MTDTITLTGLVATTPRHLTTSANLPITSFRLASTQRRFDRAQNKWVDAETNWYTITTFRQLALNAGASIKKGDRVVVSGRLRLRDWQSGEKAGTNIDVEADALGHDLSWGTASWLRTTAMASAARADANGLVAEEFPSSADTRADATLADPDHRVDEADRADRADGADGTVARAAGFSNDEFSEPVSEDSMATPF